MTDVSSHAAAAVLPALEQQLHRFFHALDSRDYPALLALFTDDCRWLRQGRWLEGKLAAMTALQARPADSETRHVLSNSFVARIGDGVVVVESGMTAYRFPTPAGTLPTVAAPMRFNDVTTVFRREPDQDWRIAEQRLLPAFGFAP